MTLQEQQEFEGDNIATIAALQMRIDELEAALKEATELIMKNAKLREDLVDALTSQHSFIAAYGEWLESAESDSCTARMNWMTDCKETDVGLEGALSQWRKLKAEHLNNKSEVE